MSNKTSTFIGTQRCGYRHPTRETLGLRGIKTGIWCNTLNQSLISPLHEQFGSNIHRSYPVSISLKTAVTGEQSLRLAVRFADVTTFIACFTGISWTYRNHIYSVLESNRFKSLPENTVRHSLNLPVDFPTEFGAVKPVQILDSDTCIIFEGKLNYIMSYLIASGFSEVSFISSEFEESTPCPVAFSFFRLEDTFSNSSITFDLRNISTKVKLFRNVTVNNKRNRCKNSRSDVDSNNIGLVENLKSFVERYKKNPFIFVSCKLELGKPIPIIKKFLKPAVRTILLNRNSDPAAHSGNRNDRISSFSSAKFKTVMSAVRNRDRFELIDLMIALCPYLFSGVQNQSGMNVIFRPNNIIGEVM